MLGMSQPGVKLADLDVGTRFLIEMVKIPLIEERLSAWHFYETAGNLLLPIEHDVKVLDEAMAQIKEGLRFKGVLSIILQLGNYINAGTYRANAKGFFLETLSKIPDTKGMLSGSEKTSLMRYVAGLCEKEYKILHAFAAPDVEWQQVRNACNVHIDDMMATFNDVKNKAQAHHIFLEKLEGISKDDPFSLSLKQFLERLKAQIDTLSTEMEKLPTTFLALAKYFGEAVKVDKVDLNASEGGKHVITEFIIQMTSFGDAFLEGIAQNKEAVAERAKAAERLKKKKVRDAKEAERKKKRCVSI